MRYWVRWKSRLSPWPGPENPETANEGLSTTEHFYQTYLHAPNAHEAERQIRNRDPDVKELLVLLARMSSIR